mmetsp:Transcript_13027/g.33949  ORF Transcript_13027/g.33949 Transcript_13027/m.33949 type:complete len:294 (+) Transcript_13027:132-1013(+)
MRSLPCARNRRSRHCSEQSMTSSFFLRYCISFRDVAKSATAIKQAIEWRRENVDVLSRIDDLQAEVKKIIPTGMLPWRTNQGQPIQVAIPFAVDVSTWATKSEEWHHEAGISNREVAYRICDQLTRETGRLVKLVMIQDLTGLSLQFAMQNSQLVKNQGKLSKLSEFLFPQLIATVVVTHPPSFIATLYKGFSPLLSERLIKKVKMAENVDKLCKYAALPNDRVPTFLGGTYEWDAEWVPLRVKAKDNGGASSNGPPVPHGAPALGTTKSGGSVGSPSQSRLAFSFNPFGSSK